MIVLYRRILSKIKILLYLTMPRLSMGKKFYMEAGAYMDNRYGGVISIGDYVVLENGVCLLATYGHIKIGSRTKINPYTVIYGSGKGTDIGNDVLIAGHCLIIPANHNFVRTDIPITDQKETSLGIVIQDDVWIGAGCQILDGVTIGKGSIIGAGSVVNKSIPEYSIAVGVPAKVIKKRVGI